MTSFQEIINQLAGGRKKILIALICIVIGLAMAFITGNYAKVQLDRVEQKRVEKTVIKAPEQAEQKFASDGKVRR